MIFNENILELSRKNTEFRHILVTNKHSQLVLMSIEGFGEIPEEIHKVDQIFFIVEGAGEALINDARHPFAENSLFIVPAGSKHRIINTQDTPLKLFTVYAPPQHV